MQIAAGSSTSAAGAIALLAVVVVTASTLCRTRHREVWIANGFGKPLRVTVGPASLEVPAGGVRSVDLPVGSLPARAATTAGTVVDEGPVTVDVENQVLVWDIGGAAPVKEFQVAYSGRASPLDEPRPSTIVHCGKRWLVLGDLDDVFARPPERTIGPVGESVLRRELGIHQTDGFDGAELCGQVLLHRKELPAALAVLEARARADDWSPAATQLALSLAAQISSAEAARVARAARGGQPSSAGVDARGKVAYGALASSDRSEGPVEIRCSRSEGVCSFESERAAPKMVSLDSVRRFEAVYGDARGTWVLQAVTETDTVRLLSDWDEDGLKEVAVALNRYQERMAQEFHWRWFPAPPPPPPVPWWRRGWFSTVVLLLLAGALGWYARILILASHRIKPAKRCGNGHLVPDDVGVCGECGTRVMRDVRQ